MSTTLTLSVSACLVLLPAFARGDDVEIKRLQGQFERGFTNAAGTQFRVVKEVIGDQSSVTTFDDAGNVVESHISTFKAEQRGQVHILSFFNLLVTAGPAKGQTDPATRSYIYRFDGQSFTEAWGLLEGDDSPPRMFVWKKIKLQ